MAYVGDKFVLADGNNQGITNDHFEILKRATQDGIKYDGILRTGYFSADTPFKQNWSSEEHWFENLGYLEACRDGRNKAEEEGIVLLEARPNLVERTILWHPDNWQPEKDE